MTGMPAKPITAVSCTCYIHHAGGPIRGADGICERCNHIICLPTGGTFTAAEWMAASHEQRVAWMRDGYHPAA